MPPEFSAGAVLVELKAQYQDLKKNVQAAKGEMTGFGTSVDATAKRVDTSGKQISTTFDTMDRKSVQLAAKLARLTGILFAAQNVFQEFAGGQDKNKGVAAASTGLSTFAAVALALPHPVGIALGAIAGLATGFASYAKNAGEALKLTEEIQAAIAKFNEKKVGFQTQGVTAHLTKTGNDLGVALLNIEIEQLEDRLQNTVAQAIRIREALNRGEDITETREDQGRFEESAKKSAQLLLAKRRDLAKAESVKDREVLAQQNKILLEGTKTQLEAGLISPLEALQVAAQAARKELDALLSDPNRDATALGLALDKAKSAEGKVEAQRRVEGLADSFGSAVSRSLSDAILNQKDPMQALADLGGALFENALNDAMKSLQTGLAEAFKAVGGTGAAASAVTGILGIGGALLAQRGKKSSESFSSVRSIVESSREVRGLVAGPSSVAIAQVGEDIARANAPMVRLLELIAKYTNQTATNTRGGPGAGASGGAEAVFVPTA